MEQKKHQEDVNILQYAWFLFKNNVLLVIIIVLLATGLGVTYSYIRKPNYTASVKVRYMATGIDGTYEDVTSMLAFIETVVDFVDEGVVLDRASYYYKKWLDVKDSNKTLDQFIQETSSLRYDPNESIVDQAYSFDKEKISVSTTVVDNQMQFFFSIQYKSEQRQTAIEKARILSCAYQNEIQLQQNEEYVYFVGLEMDIDEKGVENVQVDVSKKKIILFAFVIGVALAGIVVFVKDNVDNTARNVRELEQVADLKVIALVNE